MGLLVAENVRKVYGGRAVVDGVSITVTPGEITGLLGPNGAGKTTTFYMVVGAIRPDSGSITLEGEDISRLPMHERARKGIGYLAQEASIFRDLTVWDNVMAILEFQGLSRTDRNRRCQELVDELSLGHVQNSVGRALSGGERRRAEIARTLAATPQFILLDEPFAGVDPIAVGEIQRIVDYLRDKGLGILITDHNVRETLSICDHTYVMSEGRILVEGVAEDIVNHPEARESYLGEDFDMSGVANRRKANRTAPARAPGEGAVSDGGKADAPTPEGEELTRSPVSSTPPATPRSPPPSAAAPAPRGPGSGASSVPSSPEPPAAHPAPTRAPAAHPAAPRSPPVPSRGRLAAWPPEPGQPMLEDDGEELDGLAGGDSIFGEPPSRGPSPEARQEAAGSGSDPVSDSGGIPWPAPPRRDGERG